MPEITHPQGGQEEAPWTLRDARRRLSAFGARKPGEVWWATSKPQHAAEADARTLPLRAAWGVRPDSGGNGRWLQELPVKTVPACDRDIAAEGPDALLWPEDEGKKGEQKRQGGDNDSASAPAGGSGSDGTREGTGSPDAESKGPSREGGDVRSDTREGAGLGGTDEGSREVSLRPATASAAAQGSGGEPTSRAAALAADSGPGGADAPGASRAVTGASTSEGDPVDKTSGATLGSGGGDLTPDTPATPNGRLMPTAHWGGVYGNVDEARRFTPRTREDQRAARRVAQALRRLFDALEVGTVGEPSPRVDAGRLVRELVGRSVRPSRWRREEREPRVRVVACDLSGSCARQAGPSLEAAAALVEADPTVVVVAHSNGIPWMAWGAPGGPGADAARRILRGFTPGFGGQDAHGGDVLTAWTALAPAVAGVVWIGDGDGWEGMQVLRRAGGRVVWLDNFACRSAAPRPLRPEERGVEDLREWPEYAWTRCDGSLACLAGLADRLEKSARRA